MKLAKQHFIVRNSLHLFWILILAVFTSPLANAYKVRGEVVPQADILLLPPVCRLIEVDQPNIHFKVLYGVSTEKAYLFDRPEYAMAKNNEHLHHWCYAVVHRMRYFRAKSASEKEFRYTQFMGDIDYVLRKSRKDWQYFHVLLVDQAEMMKVRKYYQPSLLKIDEALSYKPDYERAYNLKLDVYLAMGDKKNAIEAGQEGLKKLPRSRSLRRQLKELGVNVPPLEPEVVDSKVNASDATTAEGTLPAEQAVNDASDDNTIATPSVTVKTNANETKQDAESKLNTPPADDSARKSYSDTGTQPKNNPYCRFCP